MKPPSELEIRRAVLEFTKANNRFRNFLMRDGGQSLMASRSKPRAVKAHKKLMALGNLLLSEESSAATSTAGASEGEHEEKGSVGRKKGER